jgi:D-2-hydroxyacid dehydrogenase (NADP+)
MSTPILIIDSMADFYRDKLSTAFPQAEFRTALGREAVTPALLKDAEAIVALGTHRVFDEELLQGVPKLRWIQALTTGTDAVTGLKSLKPDVVITTNTGIHGPQMSEMTLMHMLNLTRQAGTMWDNQKQGRWVRLPQIRLCDKTVVIVGVGSITEALAPRCKALGMKVHGVSSTLREVPGIDRMHPREELEQVAALADFLVVMVPLTPENVKLISARVIAAMKPSAYLINMARGAVVDEEAMIAALRAGKIAGAGLDTATKMPLPPDHPLWHVPNVLITPQLGGGSEVNHLLTLPIVEKNMRCFFDGRFQDMVNRVAH